MTDALRATVAAELAAAVPNEVQVFAARLASGARRPPLAILFYGSALRTGDLGGILDFYAVLEGPNDWSQGPVAAFANRLLPPNVEYHEMRVGSLKLRAKVAILTLRQFRRLCRPESLDNSVWARFSQPASLAFARDREAADALAAALAEAVSAAAVWAVRLGPEGAGPLDLWRALFRRTYASELRVEQAGRSDSIVDHAPERYRRIMPSALAAAGLDPGPPGRAARHSSGKAGPSGIRTERQDHRAWTRRRRLAKPLNLARLAKAAFTFRGGAHYIAWKIARHAGADLGLGLTERQRRHPILASGPILWRLWRRRRASG